jgi:histidinol-phosphate aminotransferase
VDFADSQCISLVARHPNVIVTRSLSKGYSLAGLRFGYLIARPEIVAGLIKVKDSYNCDTLSQLGAAAALDYQPYLAETRSKILATRRRLTDAMRDLGYHVPESQANFVWCTDGPPAAPTYDALKTRKILVRLMRYPGLPDGLRISVGTDPEIDALLEALRSLV